MSFPWASYYAIATVALHWPESRFWKSTPRIISLLWAETLRLVGLGAESDAPADDNVVYRDGKAFKRVSAMDAGSWAENIF